MKILEYHGLDIAGVEQPYLKVVEMLARDDFRSAEVKKLVPTGYYRAKLDYSNRLLFQIRQNGGNRYALLLEVIRNHAYDKSRFLRGIQIDESKVPDLTSMEELPSAEIPTLPYVNPASPRFHLLDKPLSFDEAQSAVYRLSFPLILIGSAGSSKTALTLEKLKLASGDVLYVTLSAFLAKNARNLYFSNAYENERQNVEFFSFREFLETIQVPQGQEINYARFRDWFSRHQSFYKFADAHKLFEEFKGVMTGSAGTSRAYLSRDQYLELGIKQSIFISQERGPIYDLFEKYLKYLSDQNLFDANILSHEYLSRLKPRYDFIVVDEVQDLTPVQLALLLHSLKRPGQFLLCGDSNQIVHPNFFSWSKIKSLFYKDEALLSDLGEKTEGPSSGGSEIIHVLRTNFRNSEEITRLSNRLLKAKQKRFGSIDRESNYLVTSIPGSPGTVEILPDQDSVRRELNEKTRKSAKFAVLVMREEQKAQARQFFNTPLLFSIQEAKGLEYENVILFNFVSSDRAAFSEIANGIRSSDLEGEELTYSRGKDKTDKSSEVYKFFVNSLYVAITRAVKNLYWIESDLGHPLLGLMGLQQSGKSFGLAQQASSLDEWQLEARKLELQGKNEQADEIRRQILQTKPVPWVVINQAAFPEILDHALDATNVSKKPKEKIFEYAAYYEELRLGNLLAENRYEKGRTVLQHAPSILKRYLSPFEGKNHREVLSQVELYGVDFRNAFNQTPLMCATRQGNVSLVEVLLSKGADPELADNYGRTAFHQALMSASDPAYATQKLGTLYPLLVPSSVDVQANERLVKLDAHTMDFFLFHVMVARLHSRLNALNGYYVFEGFDTADLLRYTDPLPENILTEGRKKRSYLSSVLSRNEVARDYAYNRRIFVRLRSGHYTLNPTLKIRAGEKWLDLHQHLGFGLMEKHAWPKVKFYQDRIQHWYASVPRETISP